MLSYYYSFLHFINKIQTTLRVNQQRSSRERVNIKILAFDISHVRKRHTEFSILLGDNHHHH